MKKIFFLCFLCFFGSLQAYSVLGIRHPYGEVVGSTSGQSRGMGGVSYALVNPKNMSLLNVANLSCITVPSFSILYTQEYTTVSDGVEKNTLADTDIPLAVMVYPLQKVGNLVFCFEQQGKTKADFRFERQTLSAASPVVFTQSADWSGTVYSGGIGFTRAWLPWLSAGVTYKRFFSYEKSDFQVDFLDTLNVSYADRFDTTALNSQTDYISFGATLQRKSSRFGISLSFPFHDASEERRTSAIAQPGHYPIIYNNSVIINQTLPPSLGAGFSTQLSENWLIGGDVTSTLWKEFRRDGYNQNLENEFFIAFGAEWVYNSLNTILWIPALPLRTGTFYKKWAVEKTQELGLTAGSGFPLGKGSGALDFSFEYSRRGDLGAVGLREDCFRLGVSLTGGSLTNKTKR
jgi:hypothetical protein